VTGDCHSGICGSQGSDKVVIGVSAGLVDG
jgi:hypothetical protein